MCNFHVLSNLLLNYICKLYWNYVRDVELNTASNNAASSNSVDTQRVILHTQPAETQPTGHRNLLRKSTETQPAETQPTETQPTGHRKLLRKSKITYHRELKVFAVATGKLLLIYICNFHVLSNLLLNFICKLHWNLLPQRPPIRTLSCSTGTLFTHSSNENPPSKLMRMRLTGVLIYLELTLSYLVLAMCK